MEDFGEKDYGRDFDTIESTCHGCHFIQGNQSMFSKDQLYFQEISKPHPEADNLSQTSAVCLWHHASPFHLLSS